MEIIDIVRKLNGPINPVGETNEDNRRFENLKNMFLLIEGLVCEIDQIAKDNKDRPEYSMSRAGKECAEYLNAIAALIKD